MNPKWTEEQHCLVAKVASLWASGMTQKQIADTLGKPTHTIRFKLLGIGVKYGRAGKLVWSANEEPLDISLISNSTAA